MKDISPALLAHLQQDTTTVCTCWRIIRTDGVIMGFTDHDRPLLINNVEYIESSGYLRTAIENSATTAVDNLEVHGFLDSDLISERDLRNGVYDYAEVEVFLCNWADLGMGILRLRNGLFGETVVYPSGLFKIELRGLTQLFSQTVGEVFAPECRADVGDSRCKVQITSGLRASSRPYSEGERVLAFKDSESGSDISKASIEVPIQNPDFELIGYRDTGTWHMDQSMATSVPQAAKGKYVLMPLSDTGKVWQISQSAFGGIPGGLTGGQGFYFSFKVAQITTEFETSATIEFLSATDVVLASASIPWGVVATGGWVERFIETGTGGVPFIPVGSKKLRLTLEWRGDPSLGAAQVLFDDVIVRWKDGSASGPLLGFVYLSFEEYNVTSGVPFWIGNVRRSGSSINLAPVSGDSFLRTDTSFVVGSTSQIVSVVTGGYLTAENIDAGAFDIELSALVAGMDFGWQTGLQLDFLNDAGSPLSGVSSLVLPKETMRPERQWKTKTLRGQLPAGTRKVRINLTWGADPDQHSTAARAAFDQIRLRAIGKGYTAEDYQAFGGVEFLCVSAGTTASLQPDFSGATIGSYITDGTVTWQCVAPKYLFLGTVDAKTDNQTFTVTGIPCEDDYLNWGVLEFLTGENVGRRMEVKDWTLSTRTIVAMMPFLFQVNVGDIVKVHVGCDKSREQCHAKFNNIINFRGEPDIPGTDQYFKVGAA